jgi:hypothetical protein
MLDADCRRCAQINTDKTTSDLNDLNDCDDFDRSAGSDK